MSSLKISSRLKSTRTPQQRALGGTIFTWAAVIIALLSWLGALAVLGWQAVAFSDQDETLPAGLTMAGLPVAGLDREEAEARLNSVYLNRSITLVYNGSQIEMPATAAGVTLDTEAMFAQVQWATSPDNALIAFWDYLWLRRPTQAEDIPLQASYSPAAIRAFLEDVADRYDPLSYPPFYDATNMVIFAGGAAQRLDVDASLPLIEAVVLDTNINRVTLQTTTTPADDLSFDQLQALISQYLVNKEVDGLFTLYLMDMETEEVLHFTVRDGETIIPNEPDVAYSGLSIMKILIMTEFYRQVGPEGALPYELDLVSLSITESSNWTSNLLINWIGDLNNNSGLYRINQTAVLLGLESTFLGGTYDSEEPPGFRFTPANTRSDITTRPDPYMQTTASDMGHLLTGIYQCAEFGTGLLIETNPGQWTQDECQAMVGWLTGNKIGVLIEAGVPAGTPVGHKHAWGDNRTIGDASMVFTPGGDYVLVYYMWRPEYAYWEPNSLMLAEISRAIYHYFNPITAD